jgi:hypothetical protein
MGATEWVDNLRWTVFFALLVIVTPLSLYAQGQGEAEPQPKLKLRSRVHARYELFDAEPTHSFVLPDARLAVSAAPLPWLRAQIDVDFASAAALRDGFVDVGPKWLRLRAGRFKRPFSRVQLMSLSDVPLWRRGIINRLIARNYQYGDRDRGAEIHGRIGSVGYAAGLFNGSDLISTDADAGKDLVARITWKLSKAARLGASTSLRFASEPQPPARHDRWAVEVDGRFRFGSFDVLAEATWAQGPSTQQGPEHAGFLIYGLYRWKVDEMLKLRPLVKAELLDHNLHGTDDQAVSLAVGLNAHVTRWLRVMLQVENVWSQEQAESHTPAERIAVLQFAFEYEVDLLADKGRDSL